MSPAPPHNRSNPDTPRRSAWPLYLGLGLAVLVLLGAFVLLKPGRSAPIVPPLTVPPLSADEQVLADRLNDLGDRFGQLFESRGDPGPLIEQIEALVADYPDAVGAHTLHGQALMLAGETDRAILALQRSLELDPRQPKIHRLVGTAAMQRDRLDVAVTHYQKALALEPDKGSHAVYLANAQHKQGQPLDAINTLLAALQRDAKLHSAYALLSDIYAEQGKLELALRQIERALEAVPPGQVNTRVAYAIKRAALLRRDGQPAESLAVLGALPAETQLRPDVLRDTAASWAMLEKPGMAARRYEQALAVDPSNEHAAAQAVHWWLQAGDRDAALKNLKALRRINPRHPDLPELDAATSAGP